MRVLICGGGIAGLTAAHFLERDGAEVHVVERTTMSRPVGSMTTLYGEGISVARAMGVLPELEQLAHRQDSQVLHDRHGRILRTYDLGAAHELQRGVLTLRRSDWHRVLLDAVAPRTHLRCGVTVTALQQDEGGVEVAFDDGRSDRFDLVLGADGIDSTIRGLAFPPGDHRRPLGVALATTILDDAGDLRTELGLAPHRVHEWFLPGRYVEITTLSPDTIALIVVASAPPRPDRPAPAGWLAQLQEHFRDAPAVVRRVLHAVDDPELLYHGDLAQVVLPRWHHGRVVLIGDAAHALSPVLGAGGSKAMRGARTLAAELDRTPHDPIGAATRYEADHRPAVDRLQRATRQMAGFALTANPITATIRRTLFTRLPERLVIRLRSAPPPGTAAPT